MAAIWKFLLDRENRAVLGWLGGGAVVVIGGLWAAFPLRPAPPPSDEAPQGAVAAAGGTAVGTVTGGTVIGSVTGGTVAIDQSVTHGATPDQIADALRQVLGERLPEGLTLAQAQGILAAFSVDDITADPARIEALLRAKADELRALQTQLRRLSDDDPDVARLRAEAADLIGRGDFDAARDRLAQARDRDRAAREDLEDRARARRLSEAATEGELGDLARLRLAYREAAGHYAAAAAALPPDDVPDRWAWENRRALVLHDLGREFGDNAALTEAIALYRDAVLPLAPRADRPLDWAATQNNLGIALATLSEREVGTARLKQAAAAFGAALEERTRKRAPLDWAMTYDNLGNIFTRLGERDLDTAWLEKAVGAYRLALEERTRDRAPLDWAGTQNNLGVALRNLGALDRDATQLEQAVDAYALALEERTRDLAPLDWAATQSNLGTALWTLGLLGAESDRLEQAAVAHRSALDQWTRDRAPFPHALTQENLALVHETLHDRTGDPAHLAAAVAAASTALEIYREAGAAYFIDKGSRLLDRLAAKRP